MASDYRNLLEQSPADVRNPYMDLLDEEDQDEKQRLRGSLSGAVTVAPDKFAAQKQVARYLGYPTSVVEALPDTEREAKVQSIDEQTAGAPATRRKFTDEDFAKLAHDDVGNLTAFEKLLRGAKGAGDYLTGLGTDGKASLAGDVSAGVWRANRGAAGLFQAGVEAIAPLIDPLAGTILPENPLRRMADALAGAGRLSEERAAQVSPAPGGIVAGGVSSGVQSLTQNILTLPVTLSNPAAGLTMMSGITGGQAYQQAREKGLGAPESLAFGASQAVIEYATEKIPVQKLIGDIAKDAGLAKTVVNQLAAELPGEQVATILQDLNEWAALNPEKPFAEYLKERPSAAAQTLIATIVGVGGNVVVAKGIDRAVTTMQERAERAARAEEMAQRLEQMDLLAAASKVRQRDPDTFEEFVRSAAEDGPVTHVYVSAEALAQSPNVEALAAVSPSIAAQLPQALATGGTVQIPIEEYATHIAGTELNQGLIDELRTEPDGFSRREAKEFMQSQAEDLKAEVEKAIAAKADDDTFKASIASVKDQIKGQLDATQRFKAEVNEAYATMVSHFFGVMGAKIGMSPEALFAQKLLQIAAESLGGRQLGQGTVFDWSNPGGGIRERKVGDTTVTYGYDGKSAELSVLRTPQAKRGKGSARAAVEAFLHETDALGIPVKLQASPLDKRTNLNKLVKFYESFGFELTGRKINDAGDPEMVRAPRTPLNQLDQGGLAEVRKQWDDAGIENAVFEKNGTITLSQIVVPKGERGTGKGTAAMQQLVDYADRTGQRVVLSPSSDFGGSKKRLVEFYKRFGFVQNKGKNKDFTTQESMIRPARAPLNQSVYTGDTIEVDGVTRPTTNSNGQPIAETEEALRAFWKWFGDSKVVDAEGRPLVVYHGTTADIGSPEFKPYNRKGEQLGFGIHFAVDAKFADKYASDPNIARKGPSPQIIPVYLNIRNPLIADAVVVEGTPEFALAEKMAGSKLFTVKDEQGRRTAYLQNAIDVTSPQRAEKLIREAGYDGVRYTSVIRGRGINAGATSKGQSWLVFRPEQIKSAVGNRGTFNPADANILNQSPYTGDTIEVDGQTRPTTNSNGQRIAETEEGLRAFWRWFGDSKVVDAEGRPLVVYHGTSADFAEFDALKTRDVGFHFGGAEAANYVGERERQSGKDALLLPVYLALNNPLRIEDTNFSPFQFVKALAGQVDRGVVSGLSAKELRDLGDSFATGAGASREAVSKTVTYLLDKGFDGLVYSNRKEKGGDSFVVFQPEQIKSATGNRGTFDPADANILNQPAYHGTPHRGIEKFSTDAIGTGEGAQAYGWGLYFASRKEIAEHYRKSLAPPVEVMTWRVGSMQLIRNGDYVDYSPKDSSKMAESRAILTERFLMHEGEITQAWEDKGVAAVREVLHRVADDAIDAREDLKIQLGVLKKSIDTALVFDAKKDPGQLYEVEVPEDDVLLVWDKPLSEQPEKVRAAIGGSFAQYVQPKVEIYWTLDGRRLDTSDPDFLRTQRVASMGYEAVLAEAEATVEKRKDRPENDPLRLSADRVLANVKAFAGREAKQVTRELDVVEADVTGEALYKGMERVLGSDKAASETLASLGIKGIKYLDGGSRTAGDGTHNYVIFSGDDVAITNQFYQNRAQGNRGAFRPSDLTITLLKDADLSTFLHELGHFFLEVQFDLASRIGAKDPATLTPGERELLADTSALLQWFGVPDLASWYNLDFEEQRSYHERFARGFESYLFEGKAPSIELHGLFQRFRSWLVNIYRELRNLNVELSDEVRGVFDRMLATNEQIQLAEQARSMMPLFESPDQAGMTVEEFAAYQALGTQATADAIEDLQARGLRDMAYSHNARGRVVKRLQKQAEELRRGIRAEVRTEVMGRPVYRAWAFLTTKDEDGGKLSREALVEAYGGDGDQYALLDWKRLTDLRMTAKEGMHPDMVADLFGFTSGDEMVRAILDATPPADEIEGLTDARMLQEHGELSSQDAIEREANRAVHNDVRARMVATEANALAKAVSTSEKVGTDKRGRPVMRPILPRAAREFAAAMIARLRIRDIRPQQYTNAEVRAAREAQKASQAGDLATAAAEKRNQLVNVYAARAAYDAQEEIDAALKYLRKFSSEGSRKGLDVDYLDQIDALLERFDLRASQSLKAVDKRAALAAWIESQREQGLEPDLPPELLNEAFRKSYKDMTVEEFRGLVDSIKQIEHLGRLKKKLLTAKDQREYEAVRDEIVARIHDKAQGRTANTRTPTTPIGLTLQQLRRFWAAHIKAATWARIFDGDANGPVWNYLIRPANDRADMETTMRAEATERLHEILAPIFKLGRMSGSGTFFPSINRSLNRQERIAIALNVGNEGNLQRLLGGEGWQMSQVVPVLKSLTAVEWQAVQEVWDHLETYRPLIAEKERRVYGKEPEWVEPRPFDVTTADGQTLSLRGGYYPIKFDPAASQRAEQYADAEEAQRQLRGAYTSATTRRSFTKSRVDEVVGRPLLYNLSGLYSGVNDVIHDLAWHEWLIDANRLLRSQSIDAAIRGHYGPEAKAQLKSWVADVAEGERGAANAGELALGRLRQGVSAAGLGFNAMSAAMQPLGFTQSIVRVGATWVGRGIARTLASPLGTAKMVNEKSEFMRNRARTRFRELNELRNKVQDENVPLAVAKQGTYFLMMRAQQIVDIPTWVGAYEKAIADQQPEDRAVALADQAVIDAQGGGQLKDLAAVERGGPALKLFTVFYSFMNTAFNLGVGQTMTQRSKAKIAVDYLLLFTAPAILGTLLKDALQPGGDDDDEDLARKLIAAQLEHLMGLMVVVREFGAVGKIVAGAEGVRDYQGPAGVRVVSDVVKLGQQTAQGEFDDAFRKAVVNVIGDLTGLPSAQVNKTITGAQALEEGETENPAALVFGYSAQ